MKRYRNRILGLFLLITFLSGCLQNQDEILAPYEHPQLTESDIKALSSLKANHKINFENAEEEAVAVMDFFETSGLQKQTGAANRSISDVRTSWIQIKSDNSLSKLADSSGLDSVAIYTFNFSNADDDSLGFAIISGDDRLPRILSCSEKGQLGDSVSNPGLATFLSRIPDFITEEIGRYEEEKNAQLEEAKEKMIAQILDSLSSDSLNNSLGKEAYCENIVIRVSDFHEGAWQATSGVEPLVKVKWGQRSPYNDRVPHTCSTGGRAPAGCVATAMAQIMSYHKYPSSYNGYNYDWNAMTSKIYGSWLSSDVKEQIAELFRVIGSNTNMDYGCDGSGAYDIDAARCFIAMGYNNPTNLNTLGQHTVYGYSYNDVKNSLSTNSPVYASGYAIRKKWGWWIFSGYSYEDGHAWVIDGYNQAKKTITYKLNLTVMEPV